MVFNTSNIMPIAAFIRLSAVKLWTHPLTADSFRGKPRDEYLNEAVQ